MSMYSVLPTDPDTALLELKSSLESRYASLMAASAYREQLDELMNKRDYLSEKDESVLATERKFAQSIDRAAQSIRTSAGLASRYAKEWKEFGSSQGSEAAVEDENPDKASRAAVGLDSLIDKSLQFRSLKDETEQARGTFVKGALASLAESMTQLTLMKLDSAGDDVTPDEEAGENSQDGETPSHLPELELVSFAELLSSIQAKITPKSFKATDVTLLEVSRKVQAESDHDSAGEEEEHRPESGELESTGDVDEKDEQNKDTASGPEFRFVCGTH